jgi:hypothetical protein
MIAPLPSNITKGSALRQLWVGGQRALRTKVYGHLPATTMPRCHDATMPSRLPLAKREASV